MKTPAWCWRDELFDYIAAGHPIRPTQLRLLLADLREIDADGPAPWNTDLRQWLGERLPELAHPKRSDETTRALWQRRRTLAGIFQRQLDEDALAMRLGERSGPRPIAEWRAILTREAERLGTLARRRLIPKECDEVLTDKHGVLREPTEIALRLLHRTCRSPREELRDFRRQMHDDRDPGPAPLGSRAQSDPPAVVGVILPPAPTSD